MNTTKTEFVFPPNLFFPFRILITVLLSIQTLKAELWLKGMLEGYKAMKIINAGYLSLLLTPGI